MLSIVPKNTRVVLIGTSKFIKGSGLDPLPGVEGNIRDLTEVFSDPEIVGIPRKNITPLLNQHSASDTGKKLAQIAKEAKDTLIVYYAGHGQIGGSPPQLYLTLSDTTAAYLQFDGIPIKSVKTAINLSGAQKKILILDCCFSGRALGTMTTQTQMVKAGIDIKGTYSIASAPANEPAIAPPGEEHTAFTGELIRALHEGINNKKERISIKDIFSHIRSEFEGRPGLPEPQQKNVQDGEEIVIAWNKKFVPLIIESALPPKVKEMLASTDPEVRCDAVFQLAYIINGNDATMAKSARKQLERLSREDPDRAIRKMASEAQKYSITTKRTEKATISTPTLDVEIAKKKAEKERLESEAKVKVRRGHLAGEQRQNFIDMINRSFTTYELRKKFNPSGDWNTALGNNPGKTLVDTRGMNTKQIFNKFNIDELKESAARNGLPTFGKRNELEDRLLVPVNLSKSKYIQQRMPFSARDIAVRLKAARERKTREKAAKEKSEKECLEREGKEKAAYYYNKGIALLNKQQYKKAADEFSKAVKINPNYSPAYLARGRALLGLDRFNGSISVLNKAIRLDPNNSLAYFTKGVALLRLGRYEEALSEANKAIWINRKYSDAYCIKGEALLSLGRKKEARAEVDKAIEIDPDNAMALLLKEKLKKRKWF